MLDAIYPDIPWTAVKRRPHGMPWPAVPELCALRRLNRVKACPMPAQYHPGRVEINYIEQGCVSWWAGRQRLDLVGGDVCVTWPDEPHGSTTGTLEVVTYYALTMHLPRSANNFLALPERESQALLDTLWQLPRTFRATPQLADSFRRTYETMPLPSDRLNAAAVRSGLVTLLIDIIAAGRRGEHEVHRGNRVATALALMQANLSEPLDLKDIAHAVGWSLPHFNARFRRETGTTPARHYLRLRVLEGVRRIADAGQPVTRVAYALGFSSSQYFATCVRRITGKSPRMFHAATKVAGDD